MNIGSVEAYLTHIAQTPLLSVEEERELITRYQQLGCEQSKQKLVTHNLRLVAFHARKYSGYNLPIEDLIQEGTIGLIRSLDTFNPELGFRLGTYASQLIKSDITEFVIRNCRIVRLATTKPQRKLFFNLRKYKTSFATLSEVEVNMIAEELNVLPTDVREMEKRMWSDDITVSSFSDDKDDNQFNSLFADEEQDPALMLEEADWHEKAIGSFEDVLSNLKPREYDIITSRYGEDKVTLDMLATKYGVSKERVRQLEAGVLKKVRSQALSSQLS